MATCPLPIAAGTCDHDGRQMPSSLSPSALPFRLLTRVSARAGLRAPVSRGLANFSVVRNARSRFTGTGSRLALGTFLLASFVFATTRIHADAQVESVVGTCGSIHPFSFTQPGYVAVDPSTSIPFPNTMHIPSRVPIPDLSLIGVGVRTVSFLRIKVYSVAFYADLNNPALQVRNSLSPPVLPRSPVDRYPSQPRLKRKSITLFRTRAVPSGLFPPGVHRIVTFETVS